MGRKVEMKKIEDITKCQVTFSKRRSSLMKKVHQISLCCDVDVAFVAFSPSGRVSKFCSQSRIEDVLHRYVNLPADKRYTHIRNVQGKQDKLRQLDHIKGETIKLRYLDKQIENLELQIRKSTLELQILEAELSDYEPRPEQEPSLQQLLWCERNLKQSFQRLMAGRIYQENYDNVPFWYKFVGREKKSNPSAGQLLMQLDPWISPYSAKVRESILQDLLAQGKRMPVGDQPPSAFTYRNYNPPSRGFSATSNQSENSLSTPQFQGPTTHNTMQDMRGSSAPFGVVGQHLGNDFTGVPKHCYSQSLSFGNQPDPQLQRTRAGKELNLDGLMSHQRQLGLEIYNNKSKNSGGYDASEDHSAAMDQVNEPVEHLENCLFDNLPLEANLGEDRRWTSGIQESGLWEWDDLVIVDNLNLENL